MITFKVISKIKFVIYIYNVLYCIAIAYYLVLYTNFSFMVHWCYKMADRGATSPTLGILGLFSLEKHKLLKYVIYEFMKY